MTVYFIACIVIGNYCETLSTRQGLTMQECRDRLASEEGAARMTPGYGKRNEVKINGQPAQLYCIQVPNQPVLKPRKP